MEFEPSLEGGLEPADQPFAAGGATGRYGARNDQGGAPGLQRVDPDQVPPGRALCGGDCLFEQRVGEDFRRSDHLAGSRHGVIRQRGERHAVAVVDPIERLGVHTHQTQGFGVQVHPTRGRATHRESRTRHSLAHPPGRFVLVDVSGFQFRREHLIAAETGQQRQLVVAERAALPQDAAAIVVVDVVAEDCPKGLGERCGFELHLRRETTP
ncbi:MAG: hypothetical protein J4F98_10140, partial [Acidobacteria bacterium]|nr:hypothetical protein [Acidobacteriota bacterium]